VIKQHITQVFRLEFRHKKEEVFYNRMIKLILLKLYIAMNIAHTIQTISLPTQTRPSSPISHLTDFPNICMELDGQDSEIALVELHQAIDFWKKPCCREFPCTHGRTTKSKRQQKKKCGSVFGRSLCGINRLTHIVNEKRYMWDTIDPEIWSEWFYADNTEEQEEDQQLAMKMQFKYNPQGELCHAQEYLAYLLNVPDNAAA